MKATHLLATIISLVSAMPCGATPSELEVLRQRCQQQEQKIHQLERQLKQLGAQPMDGDKQVEKPGAVSADQTGHTYTVQAGDNVDKIARRHGCSVAALNALNGLQEKTVIFPGQSLKLPTKSQTADPKPTRAEEAPATVRETGRTHTIQQGETYTSISRKYKIPVNTLVSLNPEVKATALRPGLKIRLSQAKSTATAANDTPPEKSATPAKANLASNTGETSATRTVASSTGHADKPKTDSASTEAAAPTAAASKTAATPAVETPASPPSTAEAGSKPGKRIRPVKIEEPMTLGQFATKHGTTPERLNDLNGLDLEQSTVLAKGSELYVPAQP